MSHFFSVIIPVYNRTEELKRAVKSVLKQSYKNFELIIIDDCSDYNIEDTLIDFTDSRIKLLVNNKNSGVSYSRNRGIKESRHDLIAFLDSDDEWFKDKL